MQIETSQAARTGDARNFAIEAARVAADHRCRQVVLLDVRGLSPVTDFMLIATGTSPRQMKTVVGKLRDFADEKGQRAFSSSAGAGESWALLDFVDVVVHVLSEQGRIFYDLDNLWGDAQRVDWQAGYSPKEQG